MKKRIKIQQYHVTVLHERKIEIEIYHTTNVTILTSGQFHTFFLYFGLFEVYNHSCISILRYYLK